MIKVIENKNVKLHGLPSLIRQRSLYLRLGTNIRSMSWLILIVAGLFEVAFAFCLGKAKASTGVAEILWMVGFLATLSISMFLLYKAVQVLPIGTSYAVWTGIGAVGTVIVGIIFFNEPADFWRVFFISTLILSIVGLRTVSA